MTEPTDALVSEKWLPVVGWEGLYEVSSFGRVRRISAGGLYVKLLKCSPASAGYPHVGLSNGERKQSRSVHSMVLEAFVGPRPPNHQAAHLDGTRTNNRLENLKWTTVKENHSHKALHGTAQRGERGNGAKLTNHQVKDIRCRRKAGESGASLAREYKVAESTISRIVSTEMWFCVEDAA